MIENLDSSKIYLVAFNMNKISMDKRREIERELTDSHISFISASRTDPNRPEVQFLTITSGPFKMKDKES